MFALLACTLCAAACRDGADAFTGTDRQPLAGSPRQLTFNPNDDLNPTWSANSDTVYYTANAMFDSPNQPSALYKMEVNAGQALLAAPGAQQGVSQTLMLGVPSPKRDRFAYVYFQSNPTRAFCNLAAEGRCVHDEPLLAFGSLRIRSTSSIGLAGYDPGVVINFQGADTLRHLRGYGPYSERSFPFQMAFSESGQLLFRPSWSPDGQKVAFSDGLSLSIWDTQSAASATIPNTQDGVSPAWSPNGARIAFTRLIRGDSVLTGCICKENLSDPQSDLYDRWTYVLARSVVTLINPDGTNVVELTDGAEPAWSPDGKTIYFTHDNKIKRIPADGGTATVVPGTDFGPVPARSPSISPDGRWLAYTRGTMWNGMLFDQNVWLLNLTGQ